MYSKSKSSDFVFGSRYNKDSGSDDDTILTLIGNKVFSYREFYKLICIYSGKKRYLIPIPLKLIKIIVYILEKFSISPIKMEQLKLFEKDNIPGNISKNLMNLNVIPQDLTEILKKIIVKNL